MWQVSLCPEMKKINSTAAHCWNCHVSSHRWAHFIGKRSHSCCVIWKLCREKNLRNKRQYCVHHSSELHEESVSLCKSSRIITQLLRALIITSNKHQATHTIFALAYNTFLHTLKINSYWKESTIRIKWSAHTHAGEEKKIIPTIQQKVNCIKGSMPGPEIWQGTGRCKWSRGSKQKYSDIQTQKIKAETKNWKACMWTRKKQL